MSTDGEEASRLAASGNPCSPLSMCAWWDCGDGGRGGLPSAFSLGLFLGDHPMVQPSLCFASVCACFNKWAEH